MKREWMLIWLVLAFLAFSFAAPAANASAPRPTKTAKPTLTRTPTRTPTRTATRTPTRTPTQAFTSTATRTPLPTNTATRPPTATWTAVPTFTATRQPTATWTPLPTNTATLEPSPTATALPSPTFTIEPSPTSTSEEPPTATQEPTPTMTVEPSPTEAATPTETPQAPASAQFYVAVEGSPTGNGSLEHPWDLQTALGHPSVVQPGSIIWVKGGVYNGNFICKLRGVEGAPITVRAVPGERVTLQNAGGAPVLEIFATYYTNIWGLEITSTYAARTASRSASSYGIRVNQGTSSPSYRVNFINMVVHDVQAQGIAWWQALTDSDIYGTLIYNNGTTEKDHGIYVHNNTGIKRFIDNIVGDNAAYGYHGYTETVDKFLNNMHVTGNAFYTNGSIGYNTTSKVYGNYKRNILIGGLLKANDPLITQNGTYYPGRSGYSLNLGYNAGSNNAIVTDNYLMGGGFELRGANNNLVMNGNTIYAPGGYGGFSPTTYPDNTWLDAKPTGLKYLVRPNIYEPNRGNLIIFNWDLQDSIQIPADQLAGIDLHPGQTYELHNAQDYYNDVVTGIYDGVALTVPMTGRSVSQPVGLNFKPASTFPEFGVFVVVARGD